MNKENTVISLLKTHEKTLATAESCTGGLLFHRLTNVPGSSKVLHFGINAYSNESKTKLLDVSPLSVKKYGAVSENVALQMAKNVREIMKSDFGIGITGIAGPDGGTLKKPVGVVFIAVATKDEKICLECLFQGERSSIKTQAVNQALKLLLEFLE